MLNPDLKLNPKIFDIDAEKKPTRDGYGEGLVFLGGKNPDVVVLTADLSESTRCEEFQKRFPRRFFECGVAEQNMAAIAAGLGVSGKIAFISSYAAFSPGKNWETIRTTIVYNNSNVKIAGHHTGIMTGPDGATHQATEDLAITRCWPNITVLVPCDSLEARKSTIKSADVQGPVYLRFTRDKSPVITTEETPFEIGKIQRFWISDKPDAAILATGYMLYYAIVAAFELEKIGIKSIVANVSTLKPLDKDTLISLGKEARALVTVEDHQTTGGLGGAAAEFYARNLPLPMEFVGLKDTFAESGSPSELIEKYGMGTKDIKEAVKKVISRKYPRS
ncbi:transketolase family protein [Patescibacteria group bacterium]|nr:transketolase family protein [Patescibacteria group bacterium]MCL5010575.1 transketolase family protein [Patescibacteria group bacterium]